MDIDDIHLLGVELWDARDAHAVTQKEVAMEVSLRLGRSVSQWTISRFENLKLVKLTHELKELAIAASAVIEKLWMGRKHGFAQAPTGVRPRHRTVIDREQKIAMNYLFIKKKMRPSKSDITALSARIGLPIKVVRTYYNNKRANA